MHSGQAQFEKTALERRSFLHQLLLLLFAPIGCVHSVFVYFAARSYCTGTESGPFSVMAICEGGYYFLIDGGWCLLLAFGWLAINPEGKYAWLLRFLVALGFFFPRFVLADIMSTIEMRPYPGP